MLRNHYLIEHWTMTDFGKNLTELRKARGASASQPLQYDIRNKTLQELCKKVDALRPEDQDVICHFLDMAVRQDKLRQIVGNPTGRQTHSSQGSKHA
ncbi:MAG: hypothetical protein IPO35_01590 [Uliginosibacterium sp.]|jgi:hypothetical protein|nr:hypothetical protein [Uliginosibacterium sp.]